MKKYHIWTEGCQMNTADSQRVASALEQLGYRAEPENFNGRALARDLLQARLGVACFGQMKRPEFMGSFSVTGTSEAEALAKAQDVEVEYRRRIAAGVEQLVQCATCPYNEPCWRLTMAAKQYTN